MLNLNDSHHGQTIEKVIRRNGHSISDLAKAMNVNRRSIYNWFTQPRLKLYIVENIGTAIGHDFTQEMPELFMPIVFKRLNSKENLDAGFGLTSANEIEENEWKDKYVDLLERYNQLLSDRMMNMK
jgi:AcrR family transcriptional regulator